MSEGIDMQYVARRIESLENEIIATRHDVEYMAGIIGAIAEGIQNMGKATGGQAMMLKAMGMPIDAINEGIGHVERNYNRN